MRTMTWAGRFVRSVNGAVSSWTYAAPTGTLTAVSGRHTIVQSVLPEAHADDIRAVCRRVVDSGGHFRVSPVLERNRQDPASARHARHAERVVHDRCSDAST